MAKRSKMIGIKMAGRTRKMTGEFGITQLENRRAGLAKILGLLAKGTRVSNHPRAVEYTAAHFGL
ncbi:hypothetical protein AEO54_053 [Vibrio phage vB_VorS-PVo5]|nr:hypothetical protein AEO54_053 [Vibrio phage vB_VorS-PVo5]